MIWLENLRRKPERERMKILVISSTLITGIIVILWLLALESGFLSLNEKKSADNSASPFLSVKNAFLDFAEGAMGEVEAIKNNFLPEKE